MLHDVIEVKVIKDYELFLKFDDGKSGYINLKKIIPFTGVFEQLKNKQYFSTVHLNSDVGTICWDNGADLAPSFLYENVKIKRKNLTNIKRV